MLLLSQERGADCLLHAGDLFHDNKPSRRALHKAMALLRRYALGDAPVAFQVLSDQAANFAAGRVNFEDPHAAVALPVFAVHGNHDDPTRDGGVDALAALDVLSVAGLVNYFGRCDRADAVERGARVARRAPRGPRDGRRRAQAPPRAPAQGLHARRALRPGQRPRRAPEPPLAAEARVVPPVSYTHLTLPTKA